MTKTRNKRDRGDVGEEKQMEKKNKRKMGRRRPGMSKETKRKRREK